MVDDVRRWETAESREEAYWLGAADVLRAMQGDHLLLPEQAAYYLETIKDALAAGEGCACCKDPNPASGLFECWSCSRSYCQDCIDSGHNCPHDNPNVAMLGGVS